MSPIFKPPTNFKPNLSANRSISKSSAEGIDVKPAGEGVLMPKPPKMPGAIHVHALANPAKLKGMPKFGRRFYGEVR